MLSEVAGHSVEVARKHYLSLGRDDLRPLTDLINAENDAFLKSSAGN